jgi:hypothetical protein
MAKFNVIIERVETTVKQAQITVEAQTAEEARQQILADLEVDEAPMRRSGTDRKRRRGVHRGSGEHA